MVLLRSGWFHGLVGFFGSVGSVCLVGGWAVFFWVGWLGLLVLGRRVVSASLGAAELVLVWFLSSLVSGCLPFHETGLGVGLRERDCMS